MIISEKNYMHAVSRRILCIDMYGDQTIQPNENLKKKN